jgi:hypothetical protein
MVVKGIKYAYAPMELGHHCLRCLQVCRHLVGGAERIRRSQVPRSAIYSALTLIVISVLSPVWDAEMIAIFPCLVGP